jgi:hypothetical protein
MRFFHRFEQQVRPIFGANSGAWKSASTDSPRQSDAGLMQLEIDAADD